MVEFKILNGNFEELGTIDDFIALIWDRKYYDVGSFELHVETKYFELLIGAAYLWSESFVDTAVIQSIVLDREKQELTITGNFLDEILRDRIITDIINANKTPEEFMRDWVNRYCIADSARRINKLKLQNATGIGYKVPVQTRGDELPSKIREIATPQECGFRLVYDYFKDEMWPEIYQGKDRTKEQTKNSLAIFSDDEDTAELKNYTRDTKDYKNFAYVAGEGDDNARIIVTVDQTAGAARRELWVDARDVQREEGESDSSYRQKLIQRGKDKLTESRISESTEFSPEETTSLIYGLDYDLGDLCTAADKKTGIKYDARVEEVVISIEKGTVTYTPTLGKPTVPLLGKPKNQTKISYSDIIGALPLSTAAYTGKYTDLNGIPNKYDVGDIYISTKSTSPASKYGGTWQPLGGKFLFAAYNDPNSIYYGGKAGGEVSHTLTEPEIPSQIYKPIGLSGGGSQDGYVLQWSKNSGMIADISIKNNGGGKSHNNMPPYLCVYMWERIA
ncbi:MAG: siphovirus ReqiPepy6 Gp37-like family protein [Clostridiales bacterium]|jgi:hypothetical protein|nr:siphovirus ReqiPepy6 Gp37-like family protein [Clostridiales bacterium]MCI1961241.1 siphovirus ReqiPepy6 Gp37-like family protein [Clostridiales bacterium]MCI2021682.1 siphovirus ReqiPepy6 Gp37-like family protein [Clostridiales bacterium]MCI2026468.1 siphovirus ReqiPepy6 Gp37-like family protein [Clostridiales bacterium]